MKTLFFVVVVFHTAVAVVAGERALSKPFFGVNLGKEALMSAVKNAIKPLFS